MKKVKVSILQESDIDNNIFFAGNWVTYKDIGAVVVVTANDDVHNFEGFCIAHHDEQLKGKTTSGWAKSMFQQFTGTITISR